MKSKYKKYKKITNEQLKKRPVKINQNLVSVCIVDTNADDVNMFAIDMMRDELWLGFKWKLQLCLLLFLK